MLQFKNNANRHFIAQRPAAAADAKIKPVQRKTGFHGGCCLGFFIELHGQAELFRFSLHVELKQSGKLIAGSLQFLQLHTDLWKCSRIKIFLSLQVTVAHSNARLNPGNFNRTLNTSRF